MTMVEAGVASRFDPMLIEHCLELAEEFLEETKPAIAPEPTVVVASGPRAWFVLQTKVRSEDKVAAALADLGFESYMPMLKKEVTHHRSGRLVEKTLRLFNRYVFAHLPVITREWRTLEAIEEIDYVLGDGSGPCIVPERDIDRFREAERARHFDVTKVRQYPVGSRIRVLTGPFGGFCGLVESLPGRGVVTACLEIFARGVPVDLPYYMVELE